MKNIAWTDVVFFYKPAWKLRLPVLLRYRKSYTQFYFHPFNYKVKFHSSEASVSIVKQNQTPKGASSNFESPQSSAKHLV